MKQKHIHFIGICGVAMSALALAFKRAGHTVTGSDVGFYPPISTYLKDAGVDFYPGWHPEKMIVGGAPDLVVVGNVAGSTNPEWLYVQEHKLNYKSYPEVIKEFFVKENSVVVAGTYGKTTSSALLTWIFKEAGYDPSYMFGGLMSQSPKSSMRIGGTPSEQRITLPSAAITKSTWSVLEGDEYKTSKWDLGAKFFHYAPTHLLLTSIIWDHADVYPTEKAYVDAFKKLICMVPKNGIKVISEQAAPLVIPNDTSVILNEAKDLMIANLDPSVARRGELSQDDKFVIYGRSTSNNYYYSNIAQSQSGIEFNINHGSQTYHLTSTCLGEYMADNITACFALAHTIGIDPEKIITAVKTFPGMKRRLEKRFEGSVTVFDDIAHSPTKATAVLETLRTIYSGKIIAVFEPNTGNRRPQAVPWYDNAFKAADIVVLPELTKIKKNPAEPDPLEGQELRDIIAKTHERVLYIENDEEMIAVLVKEVTAGDVIVFLGSHGFRGMIEELVNKLTS